MKKVLFSISAVLLFTTGNAIGETHYVLPGDIIQTAVDQAKNGDTVVVLGGEYPHDVSITKNIKLKKIFGENVSINGDLVIEGLTEHFELSGFTLRGDTENNWDVRITNCKSISLVNLIEGTDFILVKDSNLICKDSVISRLELDDCVSEVTRSNIYHLDVKGNKPIPGSRFVKCQFNDVNIFEGPDDSAHVFFQNTMVHAEGHGNPITKLIFSYNMMRYYYTHHRGELRMIGNVIDGLYNGPNIETKEWPNHNQDFLVIWRNMHNDPETKFYAYNNIIRNNDHPNACGFRFDNSYNTTIKIYNNILYNIGRPSNYGGWWEGRGIGIDATPSLAEIKSNFFHNLNTSSPSFVLSLSVSTSSGFVFDRLISAPSLKPSPSVSATSGLVL